MVEAYWGKQVHSWADCHLLIEEHVNHTSMEEGEEALPVQIDGHDDADDDDKDDDYGGDDMDADDDDDACGEEGERDGDGDDESNDDDDDLGNEGDRDDVAGYSPTSPAPEECDGADVADFSHADHPQVS